VGDDQGHRRGAQGGAEVVSSSILVFNVQKDRDHSVQMREVRHFMRGGEDRSSPQVAGLISFNEVYHLGKELIRTGKAEGYGVHHPAEERGQNWNAAAWDETYWECLARRVPQVVADGYQNLPPRWATYQLLQDKVSHERICWWVVHYPPSWEAGLVKGNVPERVANARETNRRLAADVVKTMKMHPHAHGLITGDLNCSALNTRRPEYPSVWYPKHARLRTAWTPALAKAQGGTLGRRPVDDMLHSKGVHIDGIDKVGFERSDHNPPLIHFHLENLRRS
jgi:hypothetical protein